MRRFCGMCDKHRTLKGGYSSAGGAPALQAGGHRFETDYLHHFRFQKQTTQIAFL